MKSQKSKDDKIAKANNIKCKLKCYIAQRKKYIYEKQTKDTFYIHEQYS